MRPACCLLLGVLAASASAQIKLSVSVGGKTAGTAVFNQHLTADGSKAVELRMELVSGTKKVRLTSQATYDANGNPVRKFLETIVPGGALQTQTVVTFDKVGANVVLLTGDGRQTKRVALVETAPRASLSEFWFLRDKPKPGDRTKAYTFNSDSLSWEITETVYVGPKTVVLGGKKVQVHEVDTAVGERKVVSFLDEKGLPLVIDDGRFRMERIREK